MRKYKTIVSIVNVHHAFFVDATRNVALLLLFGHVCFPPFPAHPLSGRRAPCMGHFFNQANYLAKMNESYTVSSSATDFASSALPLGNDSSLVPLVPVNPTVEYSHLKYGWAMDYSCTKVNLTPPCSFRSTCNGARWSEVSCWVFNECTVLITHCTPRKFNARMCAFSSVLPCCLAYEYSRGSVRNLECLFSRLMWYPMA